MTIEPRSSVSWLVLVSLAHVLVILPAVACLTQLPSFEALQTITLAFLIDHHGLSLVQFSSQ